MVEINPLVEGLGRNPFVRLADLLAEPPHVTARKPEVEHHGDGVAAENMLSNAHAPNEHRVLRTLQQVCEFLDRRAGKSGGGRQVVEGKFVATSAQRGPVRRG